MSNNFTLVNHRRRYNRGKNLNRNAIQGIATQDCEKIDSELFWW